MGTLDNAASQIHYDVLVIYMSQTTNLIALLYLCRC